jgi:hypothetical protein
MDDLTAFERRFEDRVRAFGRVGVRPVDSAAVARAVAVGDPRRLRAGSALRRLGFPFDRRAWAVVLALGLLAILLGGTLLVGGSLVPSTLLDARTAVLPSQGQGQPAVVGPTATPSVRPTPTISPLVWTTASLDEDWPAPVRAEPVGGAVVRPIPAKPDPDPSGDTGSAAHPWVDIRKVHGGGSDITIDLASNLPPLVPPTVQWIAYGVVVDDDRDGIPDRRFGIDNIPATAPDADQHRAWITDLHTGRTVAAVGRPYGYVGQTFFDTFFPGERSGIGAFLNFGGDTAGGGFHGGLVDPFYAWASVIADGRVVATDYAPDVGWLDPSLEAKP